jgi:outer membrane receptor for monomeric catechols
VNIYSPQFTYLPFNGPTTLAGLPTKIAIDTKSVYLIDTANYNDLVILNGGVRFDDYNIKVSGFGTVGRTSSTRRNSIMACRISTSASCSSRCRLRASMPPMRRHPTRSALNSTAPVPSMAGLRRR